MINREETDWYKDAIIYQTHVKAFYDSNGDGIGDFKGLTEKLDYIADLGATAIWLLPFYPSPLRDDGYDIADYSTVNPAYGTMEDFKTFLDAAHERGMRVITELVINHTSDQHEWFQRARNAPKGSPERDFYVWHDDDKKFPETRIIFLDTERSNWTWDPVAQQYFWHRFYSHQPDLNFDNPEVRREVINILHYWLEAGVDGLRLDAVPYLIEREGTNNENLPETHDILKEIRAEVDSRYGDRMLLAEANQWPEDTAEYFGDGDECHMAFHFPLMPRMYMAIAQEDRHPITDIMRQTPEIPEGAQWAIFLRNHDELTLEMVTSEERDYLWSTYAADRRARINLGIRRRLAPLLGNDRRKIELMQGLLLSMPGTPVLYYGDEIGMGDNIYLGDRDGVRTPMQWSPDRNGGFSRCNPAQLFSQPIMDPLYGFGALNVEAQQANPASLLNWSRRALSIRRNHKAFGRGTLSFLYPGNRKVLAYMREFEGETILCVVNLSSRAQSVELDLSAYEGYTPIELSGRTAFPPVGEWPYLLTMPGYGFYWFRLTEKTDVPAWHEEFPEPLPDLATVVLRDREARLDEGDPKKTLEHTVFPAFLPKQRWYATKDEKLTGISVEQIGRLETNEPLRLLIVKAETKSGGKSYFVPIAAQYDTERPTSSLLPFTISKARRGPTVGSLYDALADDSFARAAFQAIQNEHSDGRLHFRRTSALSADPLAEDTEITRLFAEQSNSSVRIGNTAIMKGLRTLHEGKHPEIEISRFLTEEAKYTHAPALLGWIEYDSETGEDSTALAVLHEFVMNQGDAWSRFTDMLERRIEQRGLSEQHEGDAFTAPPVHDAFRILGTRIGELHAAFQTPTDNPDFKAEPIGADDLSHWQERALAMADEAIAAARQAGDTRLADRAGDIRAELQKIAGMTPAGVKTRTHGDLHLGQVLVAQDDFYVLDFEGEPRRSLEERRRKTCALRDAAGMLRSFDYAAAMGARETSAQGAIDEETARREADQWLSEADFGFMKGYIGAVEAADARMPDIELERALLRFFMLEKALYEVTYEAANRPAWLDVPVQGILRILDRKGA